MGQYVTRNGKTYYKADSGKLYKDYLAATLAMDSTVGEDIQRLTRATGRALGDLGTAITGGLQDFQRGLEQAPNPYAPVSPQPSLTPNRVIPGQLPADYKRTELLAAGQIPGQLPADYKETELRAGQLAEQYRPGAGFPGQQTAIVRGLTPTGEVDRTQSDEYKSIRAQYDKARKELPAAEARDKGLELWAQANPVLAQKLQEQAYLAPLEKGPDGMRTATYNPLMQSTFGYQRGQAPGQFQPNYEGEELIQAYGQSQNPDPLVQQEMQQEKTAEQAAQATTAGMSARDKADDLINRFTGTTPSPFPTKRVF
jgi:hypothetical protein